jgi:hypothetical protein
MMKLARYILGFVGYVVVWFAVTALIVLAVHDVIPGAEVEILGVDWAAIPAGFVGVVAAYAAYRVISGDRSQKGAR